MYKTKYQLKQRAIYRKEVIENVIVFILVIGVVFILYLALIGVCQLAIMFQ